MIKLFPNTSGLELNTLTIKELEKFRDQFEITKLKTAAGDISIYKNCILPDQTAMVSQTLYERLIKIFEKHCTQVDE